MRRTSASVLLSKRDFDVIAMLQEVWGLRGEQYFRTEKKSLMTNANEKRKWG
jgi:hypothetical protein